MSTPAEELRTAAAKLRTLATAAADDSGKPRWTSIRVFPDQPDSTASAVWAEGVRPIFRISQGRYVRGPIADYIAAVDPAVGLVLADWLDATAASSHDEGEALIAEALTVARAINGSPR